MSFRLHGRRRVTPTDARSTSVDPNRLPLTRDELGRGAVLTPLDSLERVGMRTSQEQMTALEAVARSLSMPRSPRRIRSSRDETLCLLHRRQGLGPFGACGDWCSHIRAFLMSMQLSVSSYNHELKHIGSILSKLLAPLGKPNPASLVKKKKEKPQLHKPFQDVSAVLGEIEAFNENLWLCCLLTYGCLLRPHQS